MKEELIKKLEFYSKLLTGITLMYKAILILLAIKIFFFIEDLAETLELFRTLYSLKVVTYNEFLGVVLSFGVQLLVVGIVFTVMWVVFPVLTNVVDNWLKELIEKLEDEPK